MMLVIPDVLTGEALARCRATLEQADWVDGRVTAGEQSGRAKHNLQLAEDSAEAQALGELVLGALARNPRFLSAALPLRIYPPLFNRYDQGMGFGDHIDNAVRFSPDGSGRLRTDVSCTLFLSDPADYDGGELVVGGAGAPQAVKAPAGALVVYPASSVHRVATVTRGRRLACFFWVQSMVKDEAQRDLLFDLDQSVIQVRQALSDDHPAAIELTGAYHNLVRMWSQF